MLIVWWRAIHPSNPPHDCTCVCAQPKKAKQAKAKQAKAKRIASQHSIDRITLTFQSGAPCGPCPKRPADSARSSIPSLKLAEVCHARLLLLLLQAAFS